jgi:hypothetical protein
MLSKFDTESQHESSNLNTDSNIFVIDLPYKLHIFHQQILSICKKTKKTKLQVIDNNALFDRYKQWTVTRKNSHIRPYTVLIVQYIPDADNTLVMQLLQSRGWIVELISSIRMVEFNPTYLNCDCIIIDYSRFDKIRKNSINQLDEIATIKLFGFLGIIFIHPYD